MHSYPAQRAHQPRFSCIREQDNIRSAFGFPSIQVRSSLQQRYPMLRTRSAQSSRRLLFEPLENRHLKATYVVDHVQDETNGNSEEGDFSLREAVLAANANPGRDTIRFSRAVFNSPQTINLADGELLITDDLTISGPRRNGVTIDAGQESRVFSNEANLLIDRLTITGGESITGGGIYNRGHITIANSSIVRNLSSSGGGVFNSNTAIVINSTFSDNHASKFGGGIFSTIGQSLTVQSSTIANNSANQGGGLFLRYGGMVSLQNSIVSGNAAEDGGHEVYTTGSNIVSNVGNLFGDSSKTGAEAFWAFIPSEQSITATSDGANPTAFDSILKPLGKYGGPTKTHALAADSPAIDAGDNASIPRRTMTDQRGIGFRRIVGRTIDVGAFELQRRTLIGFSERFDTSRLDANRGPFEFATTIHFGSLT